MDNNFHTQPAECREYFVDGTETMAGAVISYRRLGKTRYVTEVNDWESDAEGYDPILVGVFDDPAQAVAEIKRRADWWLSGAPLVDSSAASPVD